MVRVGDLNTEDPGLNPWLGLPNGFAFGDPGGKFTMLCKKPTGLPLPVEVFNWKKGEFKRDTENPLSGSC